MRPLSTLALLLLAPAVSGAGLLTPPLGTSPGWTVEGDATLQALGFSVASGDINGDGYADVLANSGSQDTNGRVFVYFGGASAPGTGPSQILTSPNAGFGFNIAYLGDWNGDGFGDVAISSNFNEVQMVEIRFGSPAGLSTSADWSTTQDCCSFGQSLAAAGDVNNDGFSDLLVGNLDYDSPAVFDVGKAYLFLGGPSASTTPAWTDEGNTEGGALYGYVLGGAGDLNRDGFDDIAVSEPFSYDPQSGGFGKVFVYLGSANGPAANPSWTKTAPIDSINPQFGGTVRTAGDVNGDGFSDLAIGDYQATVSLKRKMTGTGEWRGRVYVYYGSSSGPSSKPSWTMDGADDHDYLGQDIVSGDINHDGYSDLIISAPQSDGFNPRPGIVSLYLGSRSGLAKSAAWSVTGGQLEAGGANFKLAVGDVNGDRRGDVMVGAPAWDGAAGQDTGRAVLYLGQ